MQRIIQIPGELNSPLKNMEYTNSRETWDGWAPHLQLPVKQDFGPGMQQHFNKEEIKDMLNFTEIESEPM